MQPLHAHDDGGSFLIKYRDISKIVPERLHKDLYSHASGAPFLSWVIVKRESNRKRPAGGS